jgi:hypothetical protein
MMRGSAPLTDIKYLEKDGPSPHQARRGDAVSKLHRDQYVVARKVPNSLDDMK